MTAALMWFRRDLRVADHPAFEAAVSEFDHVIPIFVWDDRFMSNSNPARWAFLSGCVADLATSLGGNLVQRRGDPVAAVARLAIEAGATDVFCSEDFGPYGRRRDGEVALAMEAAGGRLRLVGSPYAVPPGTVYNSSGGPFQVFTPFSRAWRERGWSPPGPVVSLDRATSAGLSSDPVPVWAPQSSGPAVGEAPAHRRLELFLEERVERYAEDRDRPDLDGTSRLSPYLKFGVLHPRQILARLDPGSRSHQKFESEVCWREFYADVLFHRPDAATQSYRPEWRSFEVDHGPLADARFEAWAYGRTGYPIVDAGMRQLLGEGWMHNRVRMIVASFLVKDLHLDWRRGAKWFLDHLVDGDLASNQLGWQWVAGSGTDAAPYFRVFNPIAQGKRFDPSGDYVRRWVPELSHAEAEWIHEPWKAAGNLFTGGYPAPIVDHVIERDEALARYSALRAGSA
jgi:deoxyribodipyrimidine photo-lyase